MKIHEYQARQILKNFDVPVPVAEVCLLYTSGAQGFELWTYGLRVRCSTS